MIAELLYKRSILIIFALPKYYLLQLLRNNVRIEAILLTDRSLLMFLRKRFFLKFTFFSASIYRREPYGRVGTQANINGKPI